MLRVLIDVNEDTNLTILTTKRELTGFSRAHEFQMGCEDKRMQRLSKEIMELTEADATS